MITLGETLRQKRQEKNLSLKKVAKELHIKEKIIEDLESGKWEQLPEPTYVKGIIRSYSKYLDLDSDHNLALYRREFDESKYFHKKPAIEKEKRIFLTPNKISALSIAIIIIAFAAYLLIQYSSVLRSPKLEIFSPQEDLSTTVSVVQISGKTDKDATISIEGNLVAVDPSGNFSYDFKLKEGRNQIEIIASKKLSPKSKEVRVVRLAK